MKKSTIFAVILGITMILLIAEILPKYLDAITFFRTKWMFIYAFLLNLLYLSFGMLIEYKKIMRIFTSKTRSINWYLFSFTILLIVVLFIPVPYLLLAHFSPNYFISYLLGKEVSTMLKVLAGILLVRSFHTD